MNMSILTVLGISIACFMGIIIVLGLGGLIYYAVHLSMNANNDD